MRIWSNLSNKIALTFFCTAIGISSAYAQSDPEKAQIILTAKTTCESAAQNRYGTDSIKSISDRVKWSNGLKGALVKMKIKPRAKKPRKYHCVVDTNATVTFFKA